MKLSDLQQGLLRVCTAAEPAPADLFALGDERRFRDYRRMVRRRLLDELQKAFKLTLATVGDDFFADAFSRFMAEAPPRSRLFHRLPVEFGAVMRAHFTSAKDIPAHSADLLTYEAAKREVANLPSMNAADLAKLAEFNFELPLVLQPASRCLVLDHAVHTLATGATAPMPLAKTQLVLFRPADDQRVKHFALNPVTFTLFQAFAAGHSVKNAVANVEKAGLATADAQFVDGLCTVLADFIDQKLVLGCHAVAPR